jgi:hypothetical protein
MNLEQILKEHNDKYEYQDLKGYEGLYKINQYGIWSCFHKKLMIFSLEEYLRINLTNHQKEKHKHSFHRLLALQYIPNPDNLPEVDHIDRDKYNNNIENLRWVDRVINANNKETSLLLKTEEELIERENKIREYKKNKAEEYRRRDGKQIKTEMTKTKDPNYAKENTAEYRKKLKEKMTEEEREEYLKKRREERPPQTEEQKEKARERARAQRERNKMKPVDKVS